jgi:branched-subunit amino acid aminotransferase/4-amino-4-deoxychorismate lyase
MPGGEAPLRYDELHEVEEVFLCNAVAGVRSVNRLDGRPLAAARSVATLREPLVKAGVAWLG